MIPQKLYDKRRKNLMEQFENTKSAIFLKGNSNVTRNADVHYEFRQNSHILYFSGIDMADVALLMVPDEQKFILFAPESNLDTEIWTGKKPSLEQLKEMHCADEVYSIDKIDEVMKKFKGRSIHSLPGREGDFKYSYKKLGKAVFEMRSIKSPEEISEIEKALEITARSYDEIMSSIKPGMNERDIHAMIEHLYRTEGAKPAFPPIITTKGAVLHSEENNKVLEDKKLLLIDSGAEVNGYSADITRTFPVSIKFTEEQKEIYNIVLRAKTESTKKVKPGVSISDLDSYANRIIAEGLKDVGILKGNISSILEKAAKGLFFVHGLSHPQGLDVHDMMDFGFNTNTLIGLKKKPLKQGNVFTIEPGIYFIDGLLNNPDKYNKFKDVVNLGKARKLVKTVSGIRIENDILVTKDGYKVLGKTEIPEQVDDLEKIVSSKAVFLY